MLSYGMLVGVEKFQSHAVWLHMCHMSQLQVFLVCPLHCDVFCAAYLFYDVLAFCRLIHMAVDMLVLDYN